MVLQLVGRRYGAEPPRPTPDFGRVSYTQFEALEAERMGKKVIYHFLDESFPVDPASPEPEELKSLQVAYQQRLKDANRLRHNIASPVELEVSIRRIKDELEALRRESEERYGQLHELAKAGTTGIREVKDEIAALRRQVADALANKSITADQGQPTPLPPDVVAKAKILIDRGDAVDRALGMIASHGYSEFEFIMLYATAFRFLVGTLVPLVPLLPPELPQRDFQIGKRREVDRRGTLRRLNVVQSSSIFSPSRVSVGMAEIAETATSAGQRGISVGPTLRTVGQWEIL
ncbi:MAG: hypothetical protein JWP03_4462 [Phycisphaerales bacterium]|jgi:hypothetical protein|nr:hypothetical protein [Phycisphaerales bacterium]